MTVDELLRDIELTVRQTAQETGRAELSERVMGAIKTVPREKFVPADQRPFAYQNHPLPIGHGQTISQPFIVALMTDCLDLAPEHSVLEIGTGCGYQAAVLAQLVEQVYTLEIVAPLLRGAQARLKDLGYCNVHCKCADGYEGWLDHSPFDRIIITAACDEVPEPLLDQLKVGGRIVVPINASFLSQELWLITKDGDNEFRKQPLLGVRFVPLTGKGG